MKLFFGLRYYISILIFPIRSDFIEIWISYHHRAIVSKHIFLFINTC